MEKTPAYCRARLAWIEMTLATLPGTVFPRDEQKIEKDIRLLQNGVIPQDYNEKAEIENVLKRKSFSNEPLKFSEITRFNTWFTLHPEKIAGQEIQTSSREFPLQIKGSETKIIMTITATLQKKKTEMSDMKQRALKLKARLLRLELETGGLEGLGELGEFVKSEIANNLPIIEKLIEQSEQEKEYKATDSLSFDEVVRLYNKGISTEEIKAWVWYKRSLGVSMTGWEKYYLSDTGEEGEKIITTKKTTIKDNHFRDITVVDAGVLLGKPTRFNNEYDGVVYIVFTALNGEKQYVSSADTRIEKTGVRTDPKLLDELVRKGVLFYLAGELVPYPIYAYGNMYDSELELEKDKEHIIEKYGDKVFEKQKEIIKQAKPILLSINNPDPKMRPKILAISDFANDFLIKSLRDETGIELRESEEGHSLRDAFYEFLYSLPKQDFSNSNPYNIWNHYIQGTRVSGKELTEEERKEIKTNARNEGEELFSRFLYEALNFEDQEKLNFKWNRVYNGQSSIAYHRIPIGFECSAKFKQFNLQFTPAQREGVAFMEAVGSGIVAYDVGVGKTMTAIISLAQAMHSGRASRPLIVVPNPTYGKWVKEIIGYTEEQSGIFVPGVLSNTKYKLQEWYNLGTEVLSRVSLNKKIPANTITIVTYEGFSKIGFSQKVMNGLFVELTNILAQSHEGMSERDKEINYQKFREIIGTGLKGTEADIDTLGIDYLVIDEAHRCKNVFEAVKADKDGKKRFGISSGVSDTGIKAFFLCNFIQRTFGRNVMLLTATPFTNSPLEIYSMLSLVAHEGMKKMGIFTLKAFFELFVLEQTEYVVNYKEEVVPRDVIKSFNNRLLLQKLIYNHINYKTGEEAGIKRPCKINLPRVNTVENGQFRQLPQSKQILTYLRMTNLQRMNQNEITGFARNAASNRSMSDILRALGYSLNNALSPFLYKDTPEDYKEFIEESPKLKYIMDCVASVKKWHEDRNEEISCQVIYMNRGKDFFPFIKEYLEKETGFKTGVKWNKMKMDEVEIISSEVNQTKKENIKEAFLDGVVKVIIGTATIREGIDLQRKGTVLYNAYPDWNPTDIRQLEGRIWRQGNEFGYVRIVMPLVQDSMDVFIFQKLEEKTSRINDIWYRGDRGNVLDLESLDPEQVKFALLTDIDALANMKLKQLKAELQRKYNIVQSNLETLKDFDRILANYQSYREQCVEHLKNAKELLKGVGFEFGFFNVQSDKEKKEIIESYKNTINAIDLFLESTPQEDKELLRIGRKLDSLYRIPYSAKNIWLFSQFREFLSKVKKAEKTVLGQNGYTMKDDLKEVAEKFKKDKEAIEDQAKRIQTEEFFNELKAEVAEKKSAMAVSGATVEQRVEEFSRLNYLMSYRSNDVSNDSCHLPEGEIEKPKNDNKIFKLKMKAKALQIKLKLLNAA